MCISSPRDRRLLSMAEAHVQAGKSVVLINRDSIKTRSLDTLIEHIDRVAPAWPMPERRAFLQATLTSLDQLLRPGSLATSELREFFDKVEADLHHLTTHGR